MDVNPGNLQRDVFRVSYSKFASIEFETHQPVTNACDKNAIHHVLIIPIIPNDQFWKPHSLTNILTGKLFLQLSFRKQHFSNGIRIFVKDV